MPRKHEILLRRGSEEEWSGVVLDEGEIGWNGSSIKVGDGSAPWGSLEAVGTPQTLVHTELLGNSSDQYFDVVHEIPVVLMVSTRNLENGYYSDPLLKHIDDDTMRVEFSTPPDTDQYRITILGIPLTTTTTTAAPSPGTTTAAPGTTTAAPGTTTAAPGVFSLSGAGTSSVNGCYSQVGSFNGKPYYSNGTAFIWFDPNNIPEMWWADTRNPNTNPSWPPLYNTFGSISEDQPTGDWYEQSGASPAPTQTNSSC